MKHLTPNCQFLINSAIQNHLSINMAQDIKIAHFIFPKTKKAHQRILDLAESLDFDQIFILGHNFGETITNNPKVQKFENRVAFEEYLKENPIKTQNILIKGSHGMRLDLLENI